MNFSLMSDFFPNACVVCYSMTSLKRCSRCQMVSYCGLSHQKEHWPEHKKLCKVISIMMKESGVSHLFEKLKGSDVLTWRKKKIQISFEAARRLHRSLEMKELNIFKFPRSCFVCHESRQNLLTNCSGCPNTSFCPDHPSSPIHDQDCAKIKQWYEEVLRWEADISISNDLIITSILLATEDKKSSNQPASMREFLFEYGNPRIPKHMELHLSVISTTSLTIFSALQKLDYTPVSTLTIHATHVDITDHSKFQWEILLHLVPNIKVLQVLTFNTFNYDYPVDDFDKEIGLCSKCIKKRRKLTICFRRCPYSMFLRTENYKEPDILMYSNLTVPEKDGNLVKISISLLQLWAELKCPLIITLFTENDNRLMKQTIKSVLGDIEIRFDGHNPFKSLLYFPTDDDGRVGSRNHHMIILKPKHGLKQTPLNDLPPLSKSKAFTMKEKISKTTEKDSKTIEKLSRSFFYASICHVCHSTNTSVTCNRCKMVFYCGKAHQSDDQSQHKYLCKAVLGLLNESGAPNLFDKLKTTDSNLWLRAKIDLMTKAKSKLGRKLLDFEEQMFMFPKTCFICHESDLSVLKNCKCGVNICKSHKNDPEHRKFCRDLSLAFKLATSGRPLISKVTVKSLKNDEDKNLPFSMESFIDTYLNLKKQTFEFKVQNFENILISDFLTNPLTLIWSLQKIDYKIDSSVVLHVIGATNSLIPTQEYWKLILYWFQKLKSLKIVFIGPEILDLPSNLETGLEFPKSLSTDKSIEIRSHALRYEEYFQSEFYVEPDIILGFNLNVHECELGISNYPWKETILTLKKVDAPFILTAGSEARAQKDHEKFCQLLDKAIDHICCERNPFAGLIPERDFETERLRFSNQYVIIYNTLYEKKETSGAENVKLIEPADSPEYKPKEKTNVVSENTRVGNIDSETKPTKIVESETKSAITEDSKCREASKLLKENFLLRKENEEFFKNIQYLK